MCKLIVVTNRALCPGDFLEQIRVLGRAGVDRIILREKDLDEDTYERLAAEVLSVCQEYRLECVLHQKIQAAKNLGVKKIHLSLPLAMERQDELKEFECVGISTHSVEQLEQAQRLGAGYVFYGHVFPTDCKKGVPPRGLDSLREICALAKVPVYAIGGISPGNAAQALEAGADGVCVMSWGMQQKEEVIRAFVNSNQ